MNADAFRHLYEYHFQENRKILALCATELTNEQFMQPVDYSHGSVREQLLHIVDVDEAWFSDLHGERLPDSVNSEELADLKSIRTQWDRVEGMMRDYLASLQDEMLATKPLSGEDANLVLWQVLLHVANHGTDHRAQILRQLNDLGVETQSQDYIFFVYENAL